MDPELLPVLRERWSPKGFDPAHTLDDHGLRALLDAARWAPSAGNSQPWAFHPVRRNEPGWQDVVDRLAGSSRPWATEASLLVVNLAHVHVEGTDLEFSEFAHYDLGQAVAHMTIQAHGTGLACRQFRAFDREGLTELLQVPPHWQVMSMTAIGRPRSSVVREEGSAVRDANITWPRGERASLCSE